MPNYDCPQNTSVTLDNSPIDCEGTIASTACVASPTAITFLNLPIGATQAQINTALVTALIAALNRITVLENA